MDWIKPYLNDDAHNKVVEAISRVENKTAAEVVPIIVRSSSVVGSISIILFLLFVSLFLICVQLISPHLFEFDVYGTTYIGIFAISLVFTRILRGRDWVLRTLSPGRDFELQVQKRAELEFYKLKVYETVDATGVLILVSLFEHKVVVLADKAISEACPADTWKEVVATVVGGIHKKDLAQGLVDGISQLGDILAVKFPVKPDDKNELKDRLIIKE